MGERKIKKTRGSKNSAASRNPISKVITELKKSNIALAKEVNDLNLKQMEMEKGLASQEEMHKMQMKVEKIAYEQKSIREFSDVITALRKDAVVRSEFIRKNDKHDGDIKELKDKLKKINKGRDVVKESRVKELEKNILSIKEIRNEVMKDIKQKYLDAEEVSAEINPLKKEFFDLYSKVSKIKREVIDFQKPKFAANVIFTISIISFIGAGVALYLNYLDAANFLGVEAIILVLAGTLIRLITAFFK